jgi:hypothetical protein
LAGFLVEVVDDDDVRLPFFFPEATEEALDLSGFPFEETDALGGLPLVGLTTAAAFSELVVRDLDIFPLVFGTGAFLEDLAASFAEGAFVLFFAAEPSLL